MNKTEIIAQISKIEDLMGDAKFYSSPESQVHL